MNDTDRSYKRQKTSSPPSLQIVDVPDEALTVVSKFLCKPSQALFAVAMTAPSPSWRETGWKKLPSATSKAIVSIHPRDSSQDQQDSSERQCQGWTTLDFVDLEYSLARRLTDDDIAAVLACIDARNYLKSLKLTGCINVIGYGLKPLAESTVIKQIDLSLVGKHESPDIWPAPFMTEANVLPILCSVIDTPGSSLKQLQLPKKFRSTPSPLLDDFIKKYDEILENQGGTCPKCNDLGWGNLDNKGRPWVNEEHDSHFYGLQNFTCYECTEHFCIETCLGRCMVCEKEYCEDCGTLVKCANCDAKVCKECGELKKCATCDEYVCDSCGLFRDCCGKIQCEECIPYYRCEYECGKAHCSCCFRYFTGNNVEKCVGCGTRACVCCRFLECNRDPENACTECTNIVSKVEQLHQKDPRVSFILNSIL